MRRVVPVLLALVLLLPAAAPVAAEMHYQTPNGTQTVASMTDALRAAGYAGPWDADSVIAAYAATTGGDVARIPAKAVPGISSYQTTNGVQTIAAMRAALLAAGYDGPQDDDAIVDAYSLTTGGDVAPLVVSPAAPARPAAPTAVPSKPVAGAPSAAGQPAPQRIVILVKGFQSDNATGFDGLLPSYLAQQGIAANHVFLFSYTGGDWTGSTWTPRGYGPSDTEQSIDTSVGRLRELIRQLRGQPVSVVGFSLGGLVAVDALAGAESEADQAAIPDRVLAISSPLNGVNVSSKCTAAARVRDAFGAAGVASFLLGGPALADLGAGGIALYTARLCPGGALRGNLAGIYGDAKWRTWRDGQVVAAMQQGAQVGTMGNSKDCLYYLALCSKDFGGDDVDDRWTNWLSTASFQQPFAEADHEWWWWVGVSHNDILNDQDAMWRAARFAAGR